MCFIFRMSGFVKQKPPKKGILEGGILEDGF
ncbi:hypothetical protein N410_00690 [Helicobacter pylori GC26]|nr:hypothetical protein N410_00690 [Helicobacter pylori GC26]